MRNFKQELIDAGISMLGKGLTVETWGNISLRDPETGRIYLTPSAMQYQDLVQDDIVVFNADGEIIDGKRKPSIEMSMHLGILQKRPDIHAVVHTHPIYSQVFAVLGQPIPAIIDEAAQVFGGEIPVAKYGLPGSKELAESVLEALGEENVACLMANHGAICLGETMAKAFKCCAVLEMTAQIYQMSLQIGKPNILSAELVQTMQAYAKSYYKQ